MKFRFLVGALALCLPMSVQAQRLQPSTGVLETVPTDGAGNICTVGSALPCPQAGGGGGGSGGTVTQGAGAASAAAGNWFFQGAGVAGTPAGGVLSIQGVAGGVAQNVAAASLPLPTGAATALNQTPPVAAGTSATSAQPIQGVTGGIAVPVADTTWGDQTSSGSITTQNLNATGAATAGSAITLGPLTNKASITLFVTGTYTGALTPQCSGDGNTWFASGINQPLVSLSSATIASFTVPSGTSAAYMQNIAACTYWRLTALAAVTGSANILAQTGPNPSAFSISQAKVFGSAGNAMDTSDGGTAAGNGLAIMGKYVSTPAVLATGQSAIARENGNGALYSDTEGLKATYSASALITPGATPTDVITLVGSASKVIRVRSVRLSALATTAGQMTLQLIKRSTTDTGGTSTGFGTIAPLDSSNAAATATILAYTANPTALGTYVGTVDQSFLSFPLVANGPGYSTAFGANRGDQSIVLRGATQVLAVSFGGGNLPPGGQITATVEWTEE